MAVLRHRLITTTSSSSSSFMVLLALFVVAAYPLVVIATSGGVMGGSSFHSSSSSSSSSESDSSSYYDQYSTTHRTHSTYDPRYSTEQTSDPGSGGSSWGNFVFVIAFIFAGFVIFRIFRVSRSGEEDRIKIVKLQVCLLGKAWSLLKDLDKIAHTADTSSLKGLKLMLEETALALLRHPDFCISAHSAVDVKSTEEDAEKHFTGLSVEERAKIDEVTLVNVDNNKWLKLPQSRRKIKDQKNEYIVVTVLVSAAGLPELPIIGGISDLKETLQKLGEIPTSKLMAAQVLWMPQQEDDRLSGDEVLTKYPHLRSLEE